MNEPETDEIRIKRLEATVDALTYLLRRACEQTLAIAADKARDEGVPIEFYPLSRDVLSVLHTIKKLKACRRKRNNWH